MNRPKPPPVTTRPPSPSTESSKLKEVDAQTRIYHFINDRTVKIKHVQKLRIYQTGCHENHTAEGGIIIVPPWWDHLEIILDDIPMPDSYLGDYLET